MPQPQPLPADQLAWRCPAAALSFATTAELPDLEAAPGQERATDAIRYALAVPHSGYNIYALGPAGIGKHSTVERLLEAQASHEPPPVDWCYVANFEDPRRPRLLRLPPGRGAVLERDMQQLVPDLRDALRGAFENEEYRTRRQVLEEELKERQEQALGEVEEYARARSIALVRAPMGFAFAPMANGRILNPEQFQELPEATRKTIEQEINNLQKRLRDALVNLPVWMKEARDRIRELNNETAAFAVGHLIDDLKRRYADEPEVLRYLDEVRTDVVDHVEAFVQAGQAGQPGPAGEQAVAAPDGHPLFRRYRVNLLVDNRGAVHAPVVYEDDPTFERLVGRIEHRAEQGALVTDFHMIRAGALHRANGGYLILDAQKLLTRPMAYDGLKRALHAREIRIESPLQVMGLLATQSLEPEPVPLGIKVVLVGERMLYYLLNQVDQEFARLFKVAADFDEEVGCDPDTAALYARLIATAARRERLKPFTSGAVGRVLEQAARWAGDASKLTTDVERLDDLLREADYWATRAGHANVEVEDVDAAVDAGRRRLGRIPERSLEQITQGTIAIDTTGSVVGQINGLSVIGLAGHAFGRPSRITVRIRMGSGSVVDIEREVKLGGPLHSKGVLILTGFLMARYAQDVPLSLSATLVFEQSYGGIDGDSASSAELYALLSAISEVPIRQSLAVTGSVNQKGEVQAIGGVNEKIEGFFDVCAAGGLDGSQGVLIPATNVRHLILHHRVIEAVEAGKFSIYPVRTIDEGLGLLTGLPAGERGPDGHFPEGSVNRKVEDRLRELALMRRTFTREEAAKPVHHDEEGEPGA